MIDWVHSLAKDWGHWMRKSEAKQGLVNGTMGRIKDEGINGAAIRSYGQKIPIVDFPDDVAEFHRAWLKLDRQFQNILWVDFKLRKSHKEKFALVHLPKTSYYRIRNRAQSMVSYEMAVK